MKLEQNSQQDEQLPLEKLSKYLSLEIPGFMDNEYLSVTQFSAGSSNLTYDLFNGGQHIILRQPPHGKKAKSAHDMSREYRLLKELNPYYPLAPNVILLCQDESIIGHEFFIMEKMSGFSINKNFPFATTEQQNKKICQQFIDRLVELHALDIISEPLSKLGKPQGYLKRQLQGWQQRYCQVKTEDVPSTDNIFQWLSIHLPSSAHPHAFIHNDYKFDNLLINKECEIIGVLDWEMATLGDPLLDLGCSLAYWIEANDPEPLHNLRMMPTHLPGMFSRQQIFDEYCQRRQFPPQSFKPYYVFGLFRLAVIAQQIYYRFFHGQTKNPKFNELGLLVSILLQTAQQQIKP